MTITVKTLTCVSPMTFLNTGTHMNTSLPLEGIRVVDLSRVFAMPYCGAYLADLGAEVIKVDTHHNQFVDTTRTLNGPYPDNDPGALYWERGGTFQTLNHGKLSVTLDLRSDDALAVLRELVSISDVVLENFTPRVMSRFGLDYPNLKAVRPDLIMVSNTGYGHSGPWTNFGAMATALEPTHGTGAFMGYLDVDADGRTSPGTVPNKIANSYTDFLASWTAQLAALVSLIHRAKTGRRACGSTSPCTRWACPSWARASWTTPSTAGAPAGLGNRHESMSPHGCYPCQGNDQWAVVAVRDDADWRAFCDAIASPELASDPRFADPVTRHGNQDELDAIISQWTSARSKYDVMEFLQNVGVPAGPVLDGRDMLGDPHLREPGVLRVRWTITRRTGLGPARISLSRGWRMSGNDVRIRKAGPDAGRGQRSHPVRSARA